MDINEFPKTVNYDDGLRFATGIGPRTDKILNTILARLTSNDFKEKLIDGVVNPITHVVIERIRPYVYLSLGLYMIIILLLVIIIFLLLKKNKNL